MDLSSGVSGLRDCLGREVEALNAVTRKFPVHEKAVYGDWLAQTYYFVSHSTRLLTSAATRLALSQNELHWRFLEHTREERGHDQLALKDLRNLGFEISEFPELPATQAFYQTQYYWIEHLNPLSLYGYILILEEFAVGGGVSLCDRAIQHHGEKATQFLKLHVREDIEHVKKAYGQLAKLTLEGQDLIMKNAKLSAHLYLSIYKGILRQHQKDVASKTAA